MTWQIHTIMILGLFAIGTVVGSFLNVCIYRIPWEKSVIWPGSHCPKCLHTIAARDNLPIFGWLALRGECRHCGARIAARYPLVEALVGLLFVGVYVTDVLYGEPIPWGTLPARYPAALVYHTTFLALLVAATFIDYDYWIIPDEITVPGMIVGIGLGTLFPEIRPDPHQVTSHVAGFWAGLSGLLVGGGITVVVRFLGTIVFRREAMGKGDITLMAMIGAFLGWEAAVLTYFLGAFVGLGHALVKLVRFLGKLVRRSQVTSADRELPYGPYLSMAAALLYYSWPWFWPHVARDFFHNLRVVSLWLMGYDVPD